MVPPPTARPQFRRGSRVERGGQARRRSVWYRRLCRQLGASPRFWTVSYAFFQLSPPQATYQIDRTRFMQPVFISCSPSRSVPTFESATSPPGSAATNVTSGTNAEIPNNSPPTADPVG